MHITFFGSLKQRWASGLTLLFFCIFFVFSPAIAVDNWWQKGADLYKSLDKSHGETGIAVEDIKAGLKEALRVGSNNVVSQLGIVDGFNMDKAIHIPLPKKLKTVTSVLKKVGMSGLMDDLELKLNRAAEIATPKAKKLFLQAIDEMNFDDVKKIYKGPKDAATRYFREKMSPALTKEMQPVVQNSLKEAGVVKAYDNVMEKYQSVPLVPDVKADLTDYAIEKGMDGIFYYMAKEEAAIRENPAKRTTELLKKIFGTK